MKLRHRIVIVFAAVFIFAQATWAQLGKGRLKTKGKVELVSSIEAIAPGRAFDVAFHFELAENWHIYWKNSGDSGLPPKVTWDLPAGFKAGELQFPIPRRLVSGGAIVTNILEGSPIFPVRITPPSTIAADSVALKAKVTYLICHTTCLRESADVRLELPVLPAGGVAKPANESLFRRARRSQPQDTSKYLSVAVHGWPPTLSPGQTFELAVDVDIQRGIHVQSHTPTNENFIPCNLFLEPVDGVTFAEPIFPPAKMRTIKYVGPVSEYLGHITIRVPAEVDREATPGPRQLAGIVKYQACNEKGTCFPPTALTFAAGGAGTVGAGTVEPAATIEKPIENQPTAAGAPPNVDAESSATETAAKTEGLEGFLRGLGLPGLLLGCFLYGLFINATPCVLPILSIKVLGFVQQAHESRGRTLVLGLAFGVGVMIFFVVLGFLAAGGTNMLQHTGAVIALCAIVLALSLSMLGVFTLQVPTTATNLEARIQKEGMVASFGKGALAPVLGFACTGPLLAGIFGWAAQQPADVALLSFLVTGFGMASPYILLGAFPHWLSFLPKPGNWMITFERIMGFLLLLMVIWLLYPVGHRIGAEGLEWTLAFFVFIAMGCWMLGRIHVSMDAAIRWKHRVGAAALVVLPGLLIYGWLSPLDEAAARYRASAAGSGADHGKIAWRTWSEEAVREAVVNGHTVLVDFTADYCTNCKVNKAVAMYRDETIAKMEALGVVAFQADYSVGTDEEQDEILVWLKKFNRLGPPLDLLFPAGRPDDPIVLPELFSLQRFLAALNQAGPSRTASASSSTVNSG